MIVTIDLKKFTVDQLIELESLIDQTIDYSIEDDSNETNQEASSIVSNLSIELHEKEIEEE